MNSEDQATLWIGAFRYYLGRMTYAVFGFTEMLIKEWPSLPEQAKLVIIREVNEAFKIDEECQPVEAANRRMPLGMSCDKAQWEKVRALWSQ